ncbi:MAG: lysostaphin resistance A-like protein [Lachnospira sp.]
MEIKKVNVFLPIFIISYMALVMISFTLLNSVVPGYPEWVDYVLSEAVILFLVLIYIALMRINIFKQMPIRRLKPGDVGLSILTGYLLIPAVIFINAVSMLFSNNYLQESSETLFNMPFFEQILLMAVIPSLVEEFVFRGLYFTTYRRNGLIGAAVMSGLVFGMFHLNINQFCYAFVMGIVMSVMVEATGSLWSSVCAHFAVNTYSVLMVKLYKLLGIYDKLMNAQEQSAETVEEIPVIGQIIAYVVQISSMAIMAVAFLLLAWLCIKKMAKRNGRLQPFMMYLRQPMPKGNWKSFITIPAVATFVMAMVYMIMIEIF